MATRRRDLLKKGKIQISSLKATHIYKSRENLDFITPSPLFLSFHLQTGYPFLIKLSECIDFFRGVGCTNILRIGGPVKSKRLTPSFCACVRTMLRYATCDLRCVLHNVVYVCSDISLSECYLGSMERLGREASKAGLKDMFRLSNDKPYVS